MDNKRLRRTQAILSEEYDRINAASISAQSISDNFKQSRSIYMQYADKIGVSKKLMSLIENQELKEELIFRASAYLFFGSAGYLFLKRFYLNELL